MDCKHVDNKFSFPFEPYDIQIDFMNALYQVLDDGKIGIFESPTGTGKSLSIICGTLTWLRDYKNKKINKLNEEFKKLDIRINEIENDKTGDWIKSHAEKVGLNQRKNQIKKELEKNDVYKNRNEELKKVKAKSVLIKNNYDGRTIKKQKTDSEDDLVKDEDEELIVNYESDDNENDDVVVKDEVDDTKTVKPKVFYCSRTHSQLSQFINEVKRTEFASCGEPLRLVALGSRGNLCVNPSVSKLANINMINDRCMELQSQKSKCPMFKQSLMDQLKDGILSEVQDIEEIANNGRHLKACSYYSSRFSIQEAEIIILPYNILFHCDTRKSLGIDLTDSVVIIDEAHNLCETINSIHSIELYGHQIVDAHSQLFAYMTKYSKRLSPKNLTNIKQIIMILNELIKNLNNQKDKSKTYDLVDYLVDLKIESVDFYKLIKYCEASQIARKLFGFAKKQNSKIDEVKPNEKPKGTSAFLAKMKKGKGKDENNDRNMKIEEKEEKQNNQETNKYEKSFGSPMYSIIEFLKAIINPKADSRIIVNKEESVKNSTIKYLLLNSSAHFEEIVGKCKSIILTGGTMQPFNEYTDQLFKPLGIQNDRITTFSCGHIIPKSNLFALALGTGPCGNNLTYTFQNQNSKTIIEETGRLIANVCNIIPGGIVCFFPSYKFEDKLYQNWDKSGIIKTIESKNRRIFREPKNANQVMNTLIDYSRCVRLAKSGGGAILFSIVGGKMSEGINFSDDLGRCVIMIGLPYANRTSSELQLRMNHLESISKGAGKIHYENLCMKAVNQSIGRSIRHKNDYAVILLLDSRYTNRQNIQSSLPNWIGSQLVVHEKFANAFSDIRNFFKAKSV